jgi:hypothetical protein
MVLLYTWPYALSRTRTPYGVFSHILFANTDASEPSANAMPHGLYVCVNVCMYACTNKLFANTNASDLSAKAIPHDLHVCKYVCMYTHACIGRLKPLPRQDSYTHSYTYTHARRKLCMYVCMYTHTHTPHTYVRVLPIGGMRVCVYIYIYIVCVSIYIYI